LVTIGAGGTIQDRPRDLQRSIDRRWAYTGGAAFGDEGRERGIVDVLG